MIRRYIQALLTSLMVLTMMTLSCEVVDTDVESGDDTEVPSTPDPEVKPDGSDPEQNPTPDPEPTEVYYVKVSENLNDWSGDYLVGYSESGSIRIFNSWTGEDKGASTADLGTKYGPNGIPAADGDPYKAVITKVAENYSINIIGVGYIGCESSSKNTLNKQSAQPTSSDTKYLWKLSYQNGLWISNASYTSRRLQWNASADIFRCYTGSQQDLTLYRRTSSASSGNEGGNPDPQPDPGTSPDPDPDPQPDPDPTPDVPPTPPVSGVTGVNGWYELPAMSYSKEGSYYVSQSDKYGKLYYAHHICEGGEKYAHGRDYSGRPMRNYTVCFSAEHHCPVWVAAPRHRSYESGASRTDAYKQDPKIPSNIQYSSKSTGGGCNKGHMLGSAERLSTSATNRQVFYYSNIAPQYSDTFNTGGGAWNNLEDWVDGHVCSDTLYVVIGAYFDKYTDLRGTSASPKRISFGGRSDVSCPTMFYYVLLRTKKGNSGKPLSQCSSSEMQCVALVRSHNTAKGTKDFATDMMPVSDLEKITGFTYFPNVPNAPKNTYSASEWGE